MLVCFRQAIALRCTSSQMCLCPHRWAPRPDGDRQMLQAPEGTLPLWQAYQKALPENKELGNFLQLFHENFGAGVIFLLIRFP